MISKSILWPALGLLMVLALGLTVCFADDSGCCPDSSIQIKLGNDCNDPCTSGTEGCKDTGSAKDEAELKRTMSYYCSAYQACSVDRDLRGATTAELQEYRNEKKLDGKRFSNRIAPDFQAESIDGSRVLLSQFSGKPVALVFLAMHCNHSMDTLPLISELKKTYEPKGLIILPVYVHSGTPRDVKQFADSLNLDFPLLMVGKEISNTYQSRMVPTTFLIDGKRNIVRQFVGFKKEQALASAFDELLDQNEKSGRQTSGSR